MNDINPPLNVAFLLDIDGTLIDLAPTPDTVTVPADLPGLLQHVYNATQGATALVSGRGIASIRNLFPDFEGPIVGQHGAERVVDGVYYREPGYSDMEPFAAQLRQAMPRELYRFFENKGTALAIHTENDLKESMLAWLRDHFAAALSASAKKDFIFISGHRVVEIKPSGFSKGTGCAYLMALPRFAGRMPVYCGDDATDRDGFAYVQTHNGLAVGVGPYFSDSSDINLDEPEKFRRWLKDYITGG